MLICQQVKRDGVKCGSPAMRGKRCCYFHQTEHEHGARRTRERKRQRWFERVDLNDTKAVQRALGEVMQRLLEGKIGDEKAAQVLGRLQEVVLSKREAGSSPWLRHDSE